MVTIFCFYICIIKYDKQLIVNFKHNLMYCKHCGKQISDDSTFCQYCGGVQTDNTTTKLSHISVDIVEHPKEPIEDKARILLKNIIKKLLQLLGIASIAFVTAFLMYNIFMWINKPCRDKEEALEFDKKFSSNIKYDSYSVSPPPGWGTYKYDSEINTIASMKSMWVCRWYICEGHAEMWSLWTFIIVGSGLLLFYFFKWLYQPKIEREKNQIKYGE